MIITAWFVAALVVALVGEAIDRGRSLYGWAIVLAMVGLLVWRLN